MSLDYDLYVIDPTNHDTSMYQLRDCLKDAIDELAKRTASLSERLNKLENESAATDNNALSKEPLIKDEGARKIVRPWANKNMAKRLTVHYRWGEGTTLESYGAKITFRGDLGLKNGATYTIGELCGEEEE